MESYVSKRKRALIVLLALILGYVMIFSPVVKPVEAADSRVKIGQATANEKGRTKGGKAGDQTGSEVAFDYWTYSQKTGNYNNWKYVFRAKDPKVAKKLASSMKATCKNDHIGYDKKWPDRVSFYDEALAVNWKIKKIENDCETTCTQAVAVCIRAAGIEMPRYWDATMVYEDLKATGKFKIFTGAGHCASDKKLEPGDILLSPGTHTAMVVESPNEIGEEAAVKAAKEAEKAAAAKAKAKAKSKSKGKAKAKTIKYKAGKNYTLKMVLNVRTGPGKNFPNVKRKNLTKDGKKHATKSKYGRLKKGTVVTCLKVKGEWMRIPSGWICCKPGNLK